MDTTNENSAIPIDNGNNVNNIVVNDKNDTDNIINDGIKDQPSNKLRYQSFEGANLFLCGGRIMLGRVTSHLLISLSLIILTWIAYTGLDITHHYHQHHQHYYYHHSLLLSSSLLLLVAVVPFLHSSAFLMTSWTIGCINISLLTAVATTDPGTSIYLIHQFI